MINNESHHINRKFVVFLSDDRKTCNLININDLSSIKVWKQNDQMPWDKDDRRMINIKHRDGTCWNFKIERLELNDLLNFISGFIEGEVFRISIKPLETIEVKEFLPRGI